MERLLQLQVAVPSTERIDRFLADQLSISRTHVARLIAAGAVTVNHERARASRTLAARDLVEVRFSEEVGATPRVLRPRHAPLSVVYEDEALLVLDKPAGLVVHPAPGHWDDTLLNVLVARGTELAGRSGEGRPGIVHRLDKDTSGLIVLAKTDAAHRRLSAELGRRRVERVYAALVWGHIPRPIDIDVPIARHPRDRKRMTVLATGRHALTRVESVAQFDVCDLVRVTLATGRTHQIRVHLHHAGHPVVGDPVYGGGGSRRMTGSQQPRAQAVETVTPRQALHAASLRFDHPVSGASCRFRSEWPADLHESLSLAMEDRSLLAGHNALEYLGFFR